MPLSNKIPLQYFLACAMPQKKKTGFAKRVLLLAMITLSFNTLFAQQKITGKVIDSLTHEPIEAVVVKDLETGHKISTPKNGDFVLKNIKGDSLLISYVGYKSKKIKAEYDKMLIELAKGVISLKDVNIVNNELSVSTNRTLSNLDLNMQPAKSA
ncbi:MAG TPA: carboxypeptidase-like regulatory domain-containing protein, partial [Mucilaginibacter sp.]